MAASEVEAEEKRARGSIVMFNAQGEGSKVQPKLMCVFISTLAVAIASCRVLI